MGQVPKATAEVGYAFQRYFASKLLERGGITVDTYNAAGERKETIQLEVHGLFSYLVGV